MKVDKKHLGLIVASFIALSFNSHFAQAARKTQDALQPSKVFAFKRVGDQYVPLPEAKQSRVVVKKTGVTLDRRNVYIGGYVVNSSNEPIPQVRIYPSFATKTTNDNRLAESLFHDVLNLAPRETRRFVIMRPISTVRELLEQNVPLAENCILNSLEM
jgi:hypothetical protein